MLLDIGLSLIYSVILTKLFEVDLSVTTLFLGVIFSVLPDIDIFIELYKRGKLGGKESGFHRELTHYPIIYIPILVVLYFYFGVFITVLFFVNILSHFLHDSVWAGWGIKWLWPLSKKNYKFFNDKIGKTSFKNIIVSWTPEELREVMRKYGDDDWFKNIYLKISPILVVELIFFILGLLVLILFTPL